MLPKRKENAVQRVRKQLGCSDKLQYDICADTGHQVMVAVLDTGIGQHPDLYGRIHAFRDFVNGRTKVYDDSGHGTHVAGCIGGNGLASYGKYKGIDPACLFCVGKVLDRNGEGTVESMYSGLEWVLDNAGRYHIRVLNISVGIGESKDKKKLESLVTLLNQIWDSGIVVVCAAGNKGPEENTISPLGLSEKVITVGCHEGGYFGNRKDLCERYSGCGSTKMLYRKPDLVAPGTDIMSCNVAWRRNMRGGYRNAYITKSGTSMATPIVSGTAALVLQKYPNLTNWQVKNKMLYSARNIGIDSNQQGWGMLDIENLFRSC